MRIQEIRNCADKAEKQTLLTTFLNECRNSYYNNDESIITDKEYDELYDELESLEIENGVVLSNSPTITVGYPVVSELEEVEHVFPPMLSLDKSKDILKMYKFMDKQFGLIMAKMDGLTCRLTYRNGKLFRAETRGDGYKGENITHNMRGVKDVPYKIDIESEVIIDGEIIVTRNTFAQLKEKFVDNKGKTYKNPRNFAAGSVRLHDSKKCAERGLQFVAWKFVKGSSYSHFTSRLDHLKELGFNITPYVEIVPSMDTSCYQVGITEIQTICEDRGYPIDGCVFSFDDCDYMEELGYTSHHSRAQIAYKFYDDKYDTVIRDIDWTMGKTGILTPTAIFDTVEIDGTEVSRASLHNLTIMKKLNVRKDCTARVFKANMIIPQIDSVDDDGTNDFNIPDVCPICKHSTNRVQENDSEVLVCGNPDCKGKLLGKLCTFVSKEGMDIDGLGESSIELFINLELLTSLADVYKLKEHYYFIGNLEGWTNHSTDKLINAIENSRTTTLDHFLTALSIDNVGATTAKTISNEFNGDVGEFMHALENNFDFSSIKGFGEKLNRSIYSYFNSNHALIRELEKYITIIKPQKRVQTDSPVSGKTFCITGTFDRPRSELKKEIENLGGISVDGVTKKTDILFVGDKAGSKLKKAQDLNIIIYDEKDLRKILGE